MMKINATDIDILLKSDCIARITKAFWILRRVSYVQVQKPANCGFITIEW